MSSAFYFKLIEFYLLFYNIKEDGQEDIKKRIEPKSDSYWNIRQDNQDRSWSFVKDPEIKSQQ